MRRHQRSFLCAATVASLGLGGRALAQTPTPQGSTDEYLYSTQPEGKTLKEGMARLRLPYKTATGDFGYDAKGKKQELPVKLDAAGGAVVMEYGLNEHVSLQARVDYVTKQELTFDRAGFRSTDTFSALRASTYQSKFAALGSPSNEAELAAALKVAVAKGMKAQGACASDEACVAAIDGGATAPAAITIDPALPQIPAGAKIGEAVVSIAGGIDDTIENGILEAAESEAESKGAVGMGDTTVGFLYEILHTKPVFVSVGAGLRFPTGKGKKISGGEMPISRGLTEFGVRTNVDLLPLDWFMITWQNQLEVQVAKGKRAVGGGETAEIGRKGARNVGFVQLKPALVPLHPSLNVLAPRVGFSYDHDSGQTSKVDGADEVVAPRSVLYRAHYSLGLDLTRYQIPVQFDVEHERPFKGKDVALATTTNTYTLKLYYIF